MNSSASTTQAQLEKRYLDQRNDSPRSADHTDLSDPAVRRSWTLSLDRRQAILNPKSGQWSVWDSAHREYIPTDLGVGAGIIFEHQSSVAIKLIPHDAPEGADHDSASPWALWCDAEGFHDPIPLESLRRLIASGQISVDARIWHTGATSWQSGSEVLASSCVEAASPSSTETPGSACAHALPEGAKFCPECGEPVRTKPRCTGCSAEFESLPRFCPECGLRLREEQ